MHMVAVSNGRRHEPAETPASPSTRDVLIAALALCRPALRIVNDRLISERAGPANLQAVNPGVLLRTGSPQRWVPTRVKERRRPESESDGPAPFRWCVCRLSQGMTRKERRLCHRFSGSIGNARMRARSGKNGPLPPKNKKNRPTGDIVVFWPRTQSPFLFLLLLSLEDPLDLDFAVSMGVVARRPFCLLVYSYVYVVAVNKCRPFLWITLVYLAVSVPYRTHNRLHSVCGCGGLW
jgi:hypothetical protein